MSSIQSDLVIRLLQGLHLALYHHESDADLLKKANVLGMLNAQEAQTGHVNMGHYDALYQQLIVKEV